MMLGLHASRRLIALGILLCIIASVGLALMVSMARAHDDWPAACCSDRDCAEVPDSFVREEGDQVHITIPPGGHPMWPSDGRGSFRKTISRSIVKAPLKDGWGVCISPAGNLLCTFFPKRMG